MFQHFLCIILNRFTALTLPLCYEADLDYLLWPLTSVCASFVFETQRKVVGGVSVIRLVRLLDALVQLGLKCILHVITLGLLYGLQILWILATSL